MVPSLSEATAVNWIVLPSRKVALLVGAVKETVGLERIVRLIAVDVPVRLSSSVALAVMAKVPEGAFSQVNS